MKSFARLLCAAGTCLLLVSVAEAQEPVWFSAQRPPRVAVLGFDDANAEAPGTRHASSVEAMLETFLKLKSQFIVVERKNLGGLLEERRRIQNGMVDIPPDDTTSRELLEKVDAYIQGTVTSIHGSRIEIDAELFSSFGGRLIAAAQRSGPEPCLRAIVERLGLALEQDFLRPSYGKLRFELTEPENVRIFLNPIPSEAAHGETNPPVERSFSVTMGEKTDLVKPWITDPTSLTIENLLSGWYSIRLARPGYEDLETDAARWEVRDRSGKAKVYDRESGRPLSQMEPDLRRFVVYVKPSATEAIDGDALGFLLHKQGGSLTVRVKRKYLDTDFSQTPQRVMLMGGKGLRLNDLEWPEEVPDNPECGLFDERQPARPDYSRTYIAAGQNFDFDQFKDGELIIDDYKGEIVPAGQYRIAVWDPNYQLEKVDAVVRDSGRKDVTRISLSRETLPLKLEVTGAGPVNRVVLRGRETNYQQNPLLNFSEPKAQRGLPVDVYKVTTNIPGLERWQQAVNLLPADETPPRYSTHSGAFSPEISQSIEKDKIARAVTITIKTGFALAGRTGLFSKPPDLFVDREVPKLLDLLLDEGNPPNFQQLSEDLAQRLKVIDLLVLNPRDMAQLRRSPELSSMVRSYVEGGGALFAFLSEAGDYGDVVGAPLVIESKSGPTDRFELAPGEVGGIVIGQRRKVEVGAQRVLPELAKVPAQAPWRMLAFTRERQGPRIIERGERESGGYVLLWLDEPGSFRGPRGETAPAIQEARARIQDRALKWARYLMVRRYAKSSKQRRQAELELGR